MKRIMEEEDENENKERWLLTYSDMITLLLALFIILYGMSAVDNGKVKQMSDGLTEALNMSSSSKIQGATENGELTEIYSELNRYIKENHLRDTISLTQTNNTVVVHMKDKVLFQPNTAILLNDSTPVLKKISKVIGGVYKEVDHITITGNTADLGNHDAKSEAFSWQLSVDRAVKVLNTLTENGVKPDKLSVEGNSSYQPVATNATEKGRSKNRRVEITIRKDPPLKKAKSKAESKVSSVASKTEVQ